MKQFAPEGFRIAEPHLNCFICKLYMHGIMLAHRLVQSMPLQGPSGLLQQDPSKPLVHLHLYGKHVNPKVI